MAQGISDANFKAVYNSLRQQGYSHADAVRAATGILAYGAAPEDPVFGTPESRVDGAPSEPLVMDAVVGQPDLGMPYPPLSYGQYRTARQRAERGLGPMPQDAMETEADVRARYDGQYGSGAYDADAAGRKARAGLPEQPTPEGYGGFAEAMAEAETGMTKAQRIALAEEKAREWDRKKAAYDQATGLPGPGGSGLPGQDGSGRDWSNWQPGQPLPAMVSDMDRALAYDARKEQERDARLQPMLEANRRDMKARKDWASANPEEAANLREGAKERAEDYRKEQLLYRMAKATGKSIEQLRAENPQFSSVGAARNGLIPSLDTTADGYQVGATPVSTSRMRDDAKQSRINAENERAAKWKAQTMLAGANPAKNAVNTFSLLTPEQQQDVVAQRMKFPNRDGAKGDEWDRRLDMMRLQMENDRTEREKDRTMTREERQAAREADERRYAAEAARREQEWKERSAQFDKEFALRQGQSTQEAEASRQRHEQGMVAVQAQLEDIKNRGLEMQQRNDIAKRELDEKLRLQQEAVANAERKQRESNAVSQYGPGAALLMAGNYEHPDSQAALRAMAAKADQTWNGFFTEDAQRLDSILVSLGIADPDRRRQIVQEYGINSDIPGQQGRGSILSAWRVRHPAYLPVE